MNKLYYYKIGISALYDDNHSTPFLMPYNINTNDKLFTINIHQKIKKKNIHDFLEYQQNLNKNQKNKIYMIVLFLHLMVNMNLLNLN